MPLKHLRVCELCDQIRWASCSTTCAAPAENVPESWRTNLQPGAGTIQGS